MATKVKLYLEWDAQHTQVVEWENYPEFFMYPRPVSARKATDGVHVPKTPANVAFKRVGNTDHYVPTN